MKKKIILIIDTKGKGSLWGRVLYEDKLIEDSGKTISQIETKMKKVLKNFHRLKEDQFDFEIQYDISGFFQDKNFLNASVVADRAGISRIMMRQYRMGNKFPTLERLTQLEKAIKEIRTELKSIKLAKQPSKKLLKFK
jgi:transcriptional regulator with XRE-family HTH domain